MKKRDLSEIRVLQISKYMYPFRGGTEQVAQDIAHSLFELGVKQKIICFNEDCADEKIEYHHNETIHDSYDGIDVVRCSYVVKVASQSLSTSYSKEFKKVMDEFQPTDIILHYPNPFVTNILLRYKKRPFKLYVYWHLDITKQKVIKHLFHNQNIDLIKRADYILGATPAHVNESKYSQEFGEKKYILPYAIDEKSLVITEQEERRAKEIKDVYKGKKICFFIGRHVPYKGLEYLIKASKLISRDDIQFLIAGKGPLTQSLKEMAESDEKIKFLDSINDSDRIAYLIATDIFCFPSITRNEGFGLALAEGMYFEHPAVTFTIKGSGVNYVSLNNITGIECPNGDSSAYANSILKLANDEKLRREMGKRARMRVLENFTYNAFLANIRRLLIGE